MNVGLTDRTRIGLTRHPWRWLASVFLAYSALWTIQEPIISFLPDFKPSGGLHYGAMVMIAVLIGLYLALPPTEVRFRVKPLDATIEVAFGDLFLSPGIRVIPVNEFFDSAVGNHVSPSSLHGQLIQRLFSGLPESFEALVDGALVDDPYDEVPRASGRRRRFAIGTTAVIEVGKHRYGLVAISRTDLSTLKASCDVPMLWRALSGLWATIRTRAGGERVALPLVGGGLAGLGLPPTQLVQLIITSFVHAQREAPIASVVRIVLTADRFEEVDLRTITRTWE